VRRLIAIPVYHLACRVGIDKGRTWSVVDELLLCAIAQSPRTIDELALAARLPRSMVVASLSRMMRFRLVEISLMAGRAAFAPSRIGGAFVGRTLPHFPKRVARRVAFVVERATGALFRRRDVRLVHTSTLDRERQLGVDVRLVGVEGGEPEMDPETNFRRLATLSVRAYDEQLVTIDDRTASRRDDEVLAVDVVDGVVTGLPRDAEPRFRALVQRLAHEPRKGDVQVRYVGPVANVECRGTVVTCDVRPEHVIVGGEAHMTAFLQSVTRAEHQVIVHSTFLAFDKFEAFRDALRAACARGVRIDVLWGAEGDEETVSRNTAAASQIMAAVRGDPDLAGRLRVHMRSTGSHAKMILSDAADDSWTAIVGSCNWLLSPFRSVELSAVLRDPHAVAQAARALSRLVARRAAAFDELGSELGLLARALEQWPAASAPTGSVAILEGEAHERVAREASGRAKQRLVFGSHRLGATARPGALLQCAAAASRAGVEATLLYTRASGPMKSSDASALEDEMTALGVRLVRTSPPRLHGKFLAWDDDDVVVTSFNWASATVDACFAQAELGVHIRGPGVAADVLRRVEEALPEAAAVTTRSTT